MTTNNGFPTQAQVEQHLDHYFNWAIGQGRKAGGIQSYVKALRQLLSQLRPNTFCEEVVTETLKGMKETPNHAWNGPTGFMVFWQETTTPEKAEAQVESYPFENWMTREGYTLRVVQDYAAAVRALIKKVPSLKPNDVAKVTDHSKHYRTAWKLFMTFWYYTLERMDDATKGETTSPAPTKPKPLIKFTTTPKPTEAHNPWMNGLQGLTRVLTGTAGTDTSTPEACCATAMDQINALTQEIQDLKETPQDNPWEDTLRNLVHTIIGQAQNNHTPTLCKDAIWKKVNDLTSEVRSQPDLKEPTTRAVNARYKEMLTLGMPKSDVDDLLLELTKRL